MCIYVQLFRGWGPHEAPPAREVRFNDLCLYVTCSE